MGINIVSDTKPCLITTETNIAFLLPLGHRRNSAIKTFLGDSQERRSLVLYNCHTNELSVRVGSTKPEGPEPNLPGCSARCRSAMLLTCLWSFSSFARKSANGPLVGTSQSAVGGEENIRKHFEIIDNEMTVTTRSRTRQVIALRSMPQPMAIETVGKPFLSISTGEDVIRT